MLYTISFITSLITLILWHFFKENRVKSNWLSSFFLLGFFSYVLLLFSSEAAFDYKLMTLGRDFLVLAVVSQAFSLLRKNKRAFTALFVAMVAAMQFFYFNVLMNTFPQIVDEKVDKVDANWELLIELKESHRMTELMAIVEKYNLTYEPAFQMQRPDFTDLDDYFAINIPAEFESNLETIKAALSENHLVEWVEENEVINIAPIENRLPTKRNKRFGINDPGLEYLWGFDAMEVDQLYQLLETKQIKPKKKALIAILDTGVDAKHEDLRKNYKSSHPAYDRDVKMHGTHCAGIAAAVTNNGLGVASFSPNNQFVAVTSIKVLSDFGSGTQRGIINGMLEAADRKADVLSMSLGGRTNSASQRAYRKAVKYANEAGGIVIAAAGNSNTDAKFFSPANVQGVITVSAIDTTLNRASFSNYVGEMKMGIAAPGVNIYSTIPGAQKYAVFSGTSMATPYVAGLVGLMKSLNPDLTTKQAHRILENTGSTTKNVKNTGRLIHPARAIKKVLERD